MTVEKQRSMGVPGTGVSELIFGTTNPAKVAQIRGALKGLGVVVRSTSELGVHLEVAETGATAQENAHIKAAAYARATGRPALAMDNALYLTGLPSNEQPGIHVRRFAGGADRPADAEVLAHYVALIDRHGGLLEGYWEFALVLARPDGGFSEAMIRSPRRFTAVASPRIVEGYPLDSIQIDDVHGKYISEMSGLEQAAFWQRVMGRPLVKFVQKAIQTL